MDVIRKCKVILRSKPKSNSSINVKDRAIAVFDNDLRQEKLAYEKSKFETEQY